MSQVTAIDGMGSITFNGSAYVTTGMTASDIMHTSEDFVNQNGVVGNGDLAVTQNATPGKSVFVAGGTCYVLNSNYTALSQTQQKYWRVKFDTNPTTVTITDNTSGNPRIDIICVEVDTAATPNANANNVATLVAVAGTPAGSPSVPATPANYLKLAEVAVANGFASILNASITDKRVFCFPITDGNITNLVENTTPVATDYTIIHNAGKSTVQKVSIANLAPGRLSNITIYTSGSGTYTVPTGVTKLLVKCLGGGAGGAGGITSAGGACSAGSGGSSGGYCEKLFTSLASSYSYAVGAAGTGGSAGNNVGGAGGNTTFSTMTANGGGGGSSMASNTTPYTTNQGTGGTATGGDINVNGNGGVIGVRVTGATGWSGNGAPSPIGGGGAVGGNNYSGTSAGVSGTYGGGGSGAFVGTSGTSQAGGNGGSGLIEIYEYY